MSACGDDVGFFDMIADFIDAAYPADPHEPRFFTQAAGKPIGAALDLGTGTGRIALSLARAGWSVTGVDCSARAIERARRKLGSEPGLSLRLIRADARDLSIGGEFDLIVACGLFFHLPDGDTYLRLLRTAARLLADGGAFLFDVECRHDGGWKGDGLERYIGRVRTSAGWRTLRQASISMPDQRQHLGLLTFEESAADGTILWRRVYHQVSSYTTVADVASLLLMAGLRIEDAWGDYDGSPYVDGHSPELIIRARKAT